MTTSLGQPSSQDTSFVNQVEISTAPEELRELITLLCTQSSSLESISAELSKVHKANPTLIKDFVVPYNGMFIILYIAQRLCRPSEDPSQLETDCIKLFDLVVKQFGANPNSLDAVMKQTVMFYVAKSGRLDVCKHLLTLGVASSLSDIHNQTALFYAARDGQTAVVEWLVTEGGCGVNHIDRNGQTALFYAAREDRVETVTKLVEHAADVLIRDIYKKRARGYLKPTAQKQTYDYLNEIEKSKDPHTSHRKLFLVRPDEPLGAAAMTLRQHKPFNPHQVPSPVASPAIPPPAKRQRLSTPGTLTPVSQPVKEKPSPTPAPSPPPLTLPGRSRFRVKAPLGKGGLESFEKTFPSIALWMNGSAAPSPAMVSPPPVKPLTRPPRAPAAGLTPPWVSVVSQLLRGPLWRYGPATIFHKPILQLPANLGPKFQQPVGEPEKKLSIDLSVIRKKLEKGKYIRLTEIDRDIRSMLQQAYALVGGQETDLGLLTKATEVYYNQQMAGSGLAAIIRHEAEEMARAARASILSESPEKMDVA